MNDYAGNPAVFPTTIPLIDDSDPPDASHFDPTGEALADRTAYLYALSLMFVNGVTGGVYTPAAPINVGGAGMLCPHGAQWEIDGNLYLDGTGSFTPTVTFDGPGALLLLQGGALAKVDSGSGLIILSGGAFSLFSGALGSFGSGSYTTVGTPAGGHTSTIDFLSGAVLGIEAGAAVHVVAAGQIDLDRGDAIRIGDTTDPLYVSARARTIAQPLVFTQPATGFTLNNDNSVTDNFSGSYGMAWLTKLVNGATLARATVLVKYAAHGAPVTVAQLKLIKVKLSDGTRTVIQTRNVNTTGGTSQLCDVIPGSTETIDDAQYVYGLEFDPENGIGAAAITWFSPDVQCTDINYARSI